MKFLIVDQDIPSDKKKAADLLEKEMLKKEIVEAPSPRAAAKIYYLKFRQSRHTRGRGHRNPPNRPGQVGVVNRVSMPKVGNHTVTRFVLGQARKDGILTHFERLSVISEPS